jgi:uncharacterized protein YdaU (DUF1376 family)
MSNGNGKLPYFPFYPKDFCSDKKVEAMNTLQVGAYTLLLCKAWEEDPVGTLPCDDALLAKYARMTMKQWLKNKDAVLRAFYFEDGRWYQKRMALEYEKAKQTQLQKSEGGKKGNAVRWPNDRIAIGKRSVSDRYAIARAFESESDSSPSSEGELERKPIVVERTPPKTGKPRSWDEFRDFLLQHLQLSITDAKWAWEHFKGNGWTNDGKPIVKWQSVCSSWAYAKECFPSFKNAKKS